MGSGIITDSRIALVASERGLNIETYKSYRDVVESLLGSGSIADGCWGSYAHRMALEDIKQHIERILNHITEVERQSK